MLSTRSITRRPFFRNWWESNATTPSSHMTSTPTIRPATPADAAAIHRIHAESIRVLCAKDYAAEVIDSWTRFRSIEDYGRAIEAGLEVNFVAALVDEPVGYATYCPGESELAALFVSPAHARIGVGRSLLAAGESHARGGGQSVLQLQSTLTSRAFYERHGFIASHPESYALPDGARIQ